jgi:hypothetical protein
MLEHLRRRIVEALQEENTVNLATSGPAGLEISPCEVRSDELTLFLLIPATSEHFVNIEANPDIAITQDHWRLTGTATPQGADIVCPETERSGLIPLMVRPLRFEFLTHDTHQVVETIDFSEDD